MISAAIDSSASAGAEGQDSAAQASAAALTDEVKRLTLSTQKNPQDAVRDKPGQGKTERSKKSRRLDISSPRFDDPYFYGGDFTKRAAIPK
ncbi:MAG: hypothetical protein V4723_13485 [Pseudomonadota bacterium]